MPWKITAAPSGGFYVVDTEGKRMSGVPHKTRAKAARQLRALYASEKEHTGVMVALFLPLEVAQSLPGESPEDMHITLAYLGDMDSVDLGKLSAAVGMVASESSPIHGKVGGIGRFTDTGSPEGDAVYLSYDSPDLPAFRERLVECLASHGVPVMSEHGFTPHITLRYIDPLESMPDVRAENVPIDFDTVTIAYGDTRIPFKLSTAIKEVSTTPNAVTAHGGPGGLLSAPGLAETIAEVVITPKRKRKKRTKEWLIEQFKHLSGEHNQKRHGWRFSGLGATRRAMGAGVSDDVKGKIDPKAERDAYRKRAGMAEIKKVEKKPERSERDIFVANSREDSRIFNQYQAINSERQKAFNRMQEAADKSVSTSYKPTYRKEQAAIAKGEFDKYVKLSKEMDAAHLSVERTPKEINHMASLQGSSLQRVSERSNAYKKGLRYVLVGKSTGAFGRPRSYAENLKQVQKFILGHDLDTRKNKLLQALAEQRERFPITDTKWRGKSSLEYEIDSLDQRAFSVWKTKELDLTPPPAVRKAALQGLALRKKYGRGGLSTQEAGA